MIVNYNAAGWEVVTQRAHGLLAAQLAAQWKHAKQPERWTETLLAIAEHDDAEVELDGEELLTETGGPLNYAMKTFDLEHCKKLYQLAITKSRYIALLTSMHMDFLYGSFEKDNPALRDFLSGQRKLQETWRSELKIPAKACSEMYDLLQWCDACSLLISQRQMPPGKRGIEISAVAGSKPFELFQLNDSDLTVIPWPFRGVDFTVRHESRQLERLQYADSADFRKAFYEAPVHLVEWRLRRKQRHE